MTKEQWIEFAWRALPYLLPILAYVIGKLKNSLKVPAAVAGLLKDPEVRAIIEREIELAGELAGKTPEERRQYAMIEARAELYYYLRETIPDSSINFLIEHSIVKSK